MRPYDQLGKWLKNSRLAAGMTQQDVSKVLMISRQQVSQIEKGKRAIDVFEFLKLVNLYNLEVSASMNHLRLFLSPGMTSFEHKI